MIGVDNFFQDMECLEPKCPDCGIILDYGVNTEYNDEKEAHICGKCGCVLK
jgi:transcription initiation factor TFIIIB Brf1 subunit/transcription initiation factor TFIIB